MWTKKSEWLSRLTKMEKLLKDGRFVELLDLIERIKEYERTHRVCRSKISSALSRLRKS